MIGFSYAKINIGLFVMNKRSDGFHSIESVFWPIAWTDALELHRKETPGLELTVTGLEVPGTKEANLVFKAYNLLASKYDVGGVTAHLHKTIPMGAGLGGGSSNATCMIRLLDRLFKLNLSDNAALELTAELGSDCPFFWNSSPALVTGRGERMTPPPGFQASEWKDLFVTVIHPGVHVSTAEAFAGCSPTPRRLDWNRLSEGAIQNWGEWLKNDFENGVSTLHPEIKLAHNHLQNTGADYVQMTGTGSAVFGVFQDEAKAIRASRSALEKNWASRSCAMNACL
jgi:4-diphosphocytidyl-2-C-methyl-D-erythritol kinase